MTATTSLCFINEGSGSFKAVFAGAHAVGALTAHAMDLDADGCRDLADTESAVDKTRVDVAHILELGFAWIFR